MSRKPVVQRKDCYAYTNENGETRIRHMGIGGNVQTATNGMVNSADAAYARQKNIGPYGEKNTCPQCCELAKWALLEEALRPLYGDDWRKHCKDS